MSPGALKQELEGGADGFLFQVRQDGYIEYSTLFGGNGEDRVNDLRLGIVNDASLLCGIGESNSTNLDLMNALPNVVIPNNGSLGSYVTCLTTSTEKGYELVFLSFLEIDTEIVASETNSISFDGNSVFVGGYAQNDTNEDYRNIRTTKININAKRSVNQVKLIVGITVGVAGALAIGMLVVIIIFRKSKVRTVEISDIELNEFNYLKDIEVKDQIGGGNFGFVYR